MTQLVHITASRAVAVLLAFGTITATAATLWFSIPEPLLKRQEKITKLRGEIVTLERQRARLGDQSRWTEARDSALGAKAQFLVKSDDSSPAATIQSVMRTAASGAGAAIISAQDFSPSGGESQGVRMNLAGDLNAITGFLLALETTRPRLIVNEFTVRRQGAAASAGDLNVTVAASALYWKEAAE